MKLARAMLVVSVFLWVRAAAAVVFVEVPIVTQVQGVTRYRTSLAVSNVGVPTQLAYSFFYRSPVDGSMQSTTLLADVVPTNGAFATDDIIEYLKSKGAIRTEDRTAALFGSLEIQVLDSVDATDISVVARTYSPSLDGGTVGISYVGRPYNATNEAFTRIVTTVRNGAFGQDGNSRANLGFVSESNAPMDMHVTYIDAATRLTLKSFNLSAAVGHLLAPREVVQLNNVFADPALAGSSRIIVIATVDSAQTFTGYAVQLDNTTNDGSFFIMTER